MVLNGKVTAGLFVLILSAGPLPRGRSLPVAAKNQSARPTKGGG